jgi:hypothetical protein
MSRPQFRATLDNTAEGELTIQVGGWDNAIMKIERNREYHSLVEFYDQPLIFWSPDGGYDYVKTVEASQGVDATIDITIEISEDFGDTWETVFIGVLALETIKEIDFYKLECGVKRNDFWSKFINRKSTPVSITTGLSLDGDAVSSANTIDINLTCQKLRKTYSRRNIYLQDVEEKSSGTYVPGATTVHYLIPTMSVNNIDEIDERFNYDTHITDTSPTDDLKYVFKVEDPGDISIEIEKWFHITFSDSTTVDLRWYVQFRKSGVLGSAQQIGIAYTGISNLGLFSNDNSLDTFSETLDIGDEIYIYGVLEFTNPATIPDDIEFFSDYENPANLGTTIGFQVDIFYDTEYQDTDTEGVFIGAGAQAILRKIISDNNTYTSTYFGSGCGQYFSIMKGLHLRGYSMSEKSFFMSFDDWWNGADPIFCLGLGYNNDQDRIEIEDREYFYDSSSNSVNLSFVNDIERGYENDFIFRKIEIGYQKWESENIAGIDDPQTKHTYSTRMQKMGKDETRYSKFVAASLAIEATRRQQSEKSKDYKLDNDTFIISLNPTPITSGYYKPELDENYSNVGALLNADTRYNLRLSPARNFLRWRPYFNGCLQSYTSDVYRFVSGEGNYSMSTNLSEATCDGAIETGNVNENGNINVTTDYLFTPEVYEFTHPLTWSEYKTIRTNRRKSIGVSRTGSGHEAFFILQLDYEITKARAKFKVLKA